MKKIVNIVILALFYVSLASAASLTLIQPNGGDLCLGQQNYQIKWTAVGVNEKIKLVLFQNNTKIASIAENLDAGGSPYLWKVGTYIGGTAAAGSGYKVRVRTMSNGIDDYSDASFSLKTSAPPCQPPLPPPPPPVLLKVESPNGGENLSLNHDYSISWKSFAPAAVGSVQLELVRYQGAMLGVIKGNLPASGSWTWKAGEYPGNTAPSGKYLIRVRSLADPAIFDESDSFFNLRTMMVAATPTGHTLFNRKSVVLAGVYQNYPCSRHLPHFLHPRAHRGPPAGVAAARALQLWHEPECQGRDLLVPVPGHEHPGGGHLPFAHPLLPGRIRHPGREPEKREVEDEAHPFHPRGRRQQLRLQRGPDGAEGAHDFQRHPGHRREDRYLHGHGGIHP